MYRLRLDDDLLFKFGRQGHMSQQACGKNLTDFLWLFPPWKSSEVQFRGVLLQWGVFMHPAGAKQTNAVCSPQA